MDDDIRQQLQTVAKNLHAVANQVASTKSNMESIAAMGEILAIHKQTLDTLIRVQLHRYDGF